MISRLKKASLKGFFGGIIIGGSTAAIVYLKVISKNVYNQLVCQYSFSHQCKVPKFDYSSCDLSSHLICNADEIINLKARADAYSQGEFFSNLPLIVGLSALGGSILGFFVAYIYYRRQSRQINSVTFYEQAPANSPVSYRVNQLQIRFDQTQWNEEIPENFQDPVTYELMDMPMVINTGFVYNASTLERIRGIPKRCPLTRIVITEQILDHFLKMQIENFVVEKELWKKHSSQYSQGFDNKNDLVEEAKQLNQTDLLNQHNQNRDQKEFIPPDVQQLRLNQLRRQYPLTKMNSSSRDILFSNSRNVNLQTVNNNHSHVIEINNEDYQSIPGRVGR